MLRRAWEFAYGDNAVGLRMGGQGLLAVAQQGRWQGLGVQGHGLGVGHEAEQVPAAGLCLVDVVHDLRDFARMAACAKDEKGCHGAGCSALVTGRPSWFATVRRMCWR